MNPDWIPDAAIPYVFILGACLWVGLLFLPPRNGDDWEQDE